LALHQFIDACPGVDLTLRVSVPRFDVAALSRSPLEWWAGGNVQPLPIGPVKASLEVFASDTPGHAFPNPFIRPSEC